MSRRSGTEYTAQNRRKIAALIRNLSSAVKTVQLEPFRASDCARLTTFKALPTKSTQATDFIFAKALIAGILSGLQVLTQKERKIQI
jgi:hypothetical protein